MHLTPVLNFKIKIKVLLSLGEILLTLYSCWLNFILTKYHLSTTRLIGDTIGYKIGFFHYQKPNVISLKIVCILDKVVTGPLGEISRENKHVEI